MTETAAFLNRTISLTAGGDGPHVRSPVASLLDHRQMRNSSTDNSPLQIFVKAKKKINDIFVEIEDYVKDTVNYIHGKTSLNITDFNERSFLF